MEGDRCILTRRCSWSFKGGVVSRSQPGSLRATGISGLRPSASQAKGLASHISSGAQ